MWLIGPSKGSGPGTFRPDWFRFGFKWVLAASSGRGATGGGRKNPFETELKPHRKRSGRKVSAWSWGEGGGGPLALCVGSCFAGPETASSHSSSRVRAFDALPRGVPDADWGAIYSDPMCISIVFFASDSISLRRMLGPSKTIHWVSLYLTASCYWS